MYNFIHTWIVDSCRTIWHWILCLLAVIGVANPVIPAERLQEQEQNNPDIIQQLPDDQQQESRIQINNQLNSQEVMQKNLDELEKNFGLFHQLAPIVQSTRKWLECFGD